MLKAEIFRFDKKKIQNMTFKKGTTKTQTYRKTETKRMKKIYQRNIKYFEK